jgi:hypothetical protein
MYPPPSALSSDEREHFYPDQVLDEHSQIEADKAREQRAYVRAIVVGTSPVRLELVVDAAVSKVIYLDRADPDAAALAVHRSRYGKLGLSVRRTQPSAAEPTRVTLDFDAQGVLLGSESESLDDEGRCVLVTRRDGQGAVLGTISHEWSADGELLRSIERGPDGTVVSVFDPQG